MQLCNAMYLFVFFFGLYLLSTCSADNSGDNESIRNIYMRYLKEHGKAIERLHDRSRLYQFRENLNLINLHNSLASTMYTLDPHSKFVDEYDRDLLLPHLDGIVKAVDFATSASRWSTSLAVVALASRGHRQEAHSP